MRLGRHQFIRATLALASALVVLPLGLSAANAATKIQRVVSPGGIEAWLVQDATVPAGGDGIRLRRWRRTGPGGQAGRQQHDGRIT